MSSRLQNQEEKTELANQVSLFSAILEHLPVGEPLLLNDNAIAGLISLANRSEKALRN